MGSYSFRDQDSASWEKENLWQDREILIDLPETFIKKRAGEYLIGKWRSVEEIRGTKELGTFILTNLRIIWRMKLSQLTNLSIGIRNIDYIDVHEIHSKFYGQLVGFSIICHTASRNYKFTFGCQHYQNQLISQLVDCAIYQYRNTVALRELITNITCELFDANHLRLFHDHEKRIYNRVACFKINTLQNCHGHIYVTTDRIVWISSDDTSNKNLSIPLNQIIYIKLHNSRFGLLLAIVICSNDEPDLFHFKFSNHALIRIFNKLLLLINTHREKPCYSPLDRKRIKFIKENFGITKKLETPLYKASDNLNVCTTESTALPKYSNYSNLTIVQHQQIPRYESYNQSQDLNLQPIVSMSQQKSVNTTSHLHNIENSDLYEYLNFQTRFPESNYKFTPHHTNTILV